MNHGPDQPLLVGAARLESMVDEFLASEHVLQVTHTEEPLFTTVGMLGTQERIATRFTKGLHQGAHLVSDEHVDDALARHAHLTEEQRGLVEAWCGHGHRYQAAVGRAGAGKTTTVAACAACMGRIRLPRDGYSGEGRSRPHPRRRDRDRVRNRGLVPRPRRPPAVLPLDARTVLVIDEASTLPDRDLDALMTMAATTGASVRLIGDPAQHGAIAAGGMFRVLCERHPTHTPNSRPPTGSSTPNDRAAAQALREGTHRRSALPPRSRRPPPRRRRRPHHVSPRPRPLVGRPP